MNTEILAIPSDNPGGLDAPMSMHFGHCEVYTLVAVRDNTVDTVTTFENPPHTEGGCMMSVQALAGRGISRLLAGGMGQRPLMGCKDAGIDVLFAGNCPTVGEAVQAYLAGKLFSFAPDNVCRGHH